MSEPTNNNEPKPPDPHISTLGRRGALLYQLSMELAVRGHTAVAPHTLRGGELGEVAADALAALCDAIVRIAALNSEGRAIIDHVKELLDHADIERVNPRRQAEVVQILQPNPNRRTEVVKNDTDATMHVGPDGKPITAAEAKAMYEGVDHGEDPPRG